MNVFECIMDSPDSLATFFDMVTHCCSRATKENKSCKECGCPIAPFLPKHNLGCTKLEILAWLESDAKEPHKEELK